MRERWNRAGGAVRGVGGAVRGQGMELCAAGEAVRVRSQGGGRVPQEVRATAGITAVP